MSKKRSRKKFRWSPYAPPLVLLGAVALLYAVTWLSDHPTTFVEIGAASIVIILGAVYLKVGRFHRRRLMYSTLGDLLAMTPTQFEREVANILAHLGYRRINHVGKSGDLAADLTCEDARGRSYVVQCKRLGPGQSVGSPAIQSFVGMQHVHHRVDRGVFVTTSRFTKPAVELAKRHNLVLIDGPALTTIAARIQTRASSTRSQSPAPNAAVPEPDPVSGIDI